METTFEQWCISRHKETNHNYDTYLPYEFHLRMVFKVACDFKRLLDASNRNVGKLITVLEYTWAVMQACWGHDLIEDCRLTYNDILSAPESDYFIADIIYAVSNEKGKTRAERANDKYYKGIRETPGATFVKICDRIANVQYSKMTASSMFDKYKKEQKHFKEMLYTEELKEMWNYLDNLFEN